MDEIKELELLIEELRNKLSNCFDEQRPTEDIHELSEQIDQLIVKHYNLIQSNS